MSNWSVYLEVAEKGKKENNILLLEGDKNHSKLLKFL